ncbi:MAG: hypothetical protein ACXVCY_02520 [Pseudobdellovibrionaceae bacterium]
MQPEKKLKSPIEIEISFDADELDLIADYQWHPLQKKIFELIEAGLFKAALETCEDFFAIETKVENKVFAVQWAVAISEVIYDFKIRNSWLEKWRHCVGWTEIFWCRYIYRDQQALGYYFASHFSEAQKIFELNLADAIKNNYRRGEMRSLYHLGLICKCRYEQDKAFLYFSKALDLARKSRAVKFLPRIEQQLVLLKQGDFSFEIQFNQVEEYLKNKNFRAARKGTLYLCRVRRCEGRAWSAKSELLLLSLVSYAYKQYTRFHFLFGKISDPIMKVKLLNIADQIEPLADDLRFEQHFLYQSLGLMTTSDSSVIFEGINFGSPKNSDAAALVQALYQNPSGLSKEDIVRKIWNTMDYDPTYHDQKIYRLINKVRKTVGRNDVILNSYNFYKIS